MRSEGSTNENAPRSVRRTCPREIGLICFLSSPQWPQVCSASASMAPNTELRKRILVTQYPAPRFRLYPHPDRPDNRHVANHARTPFLG